MIFVRKNIRRIFFFWYSHLFADYFLNISGVRLFVPNFWLFSILVYSITLIYIWLDLVTQTAGEISTINMKRDCTVYTSHRMRERKININIYSIRMIINGWCVALSLRMIESKAFIHSKYNESSDFMVKYNAKVEKESQKGFLIAAIDVPRVLHHTISIPCMNVCHNRWHTLKISYLTTTRRREKKPQLIAYQNAVGWVFFVTLLLVYIYVCVWWNECGEFMMRMCKEFDFMNECDRDKRDEDVHFHLWNS